MSGVRSYAKALVEYTQSASGEARAKVFEELGLLSDAISKTASLERLFFTPTTSRPEKLALLEKVFSGLGVSVPAANFMRLLAKKGRLSHLPEIVKAIDDVRLESEGILKGEVQSSEVVSDGDLSELSAAFSRKLGKPVQFKASVNPLLLAGLKVTVQGVTYDGTLKGQLERVKRELSQDRDGAAFSNEINN